MRSVDVLLTCDIHTHTYSPAKVDADLTQARAVLREQGLPCTFLFPSTSAECLQEQVLALQQEGHEIGCHGCTHDPETENLGFMPLPEQRRVLTTATESLTHILGEPPVTFRAPAFKCSGDTIRVIQELGYQADLSVVARRLSVFGSDVYNLRPLFAPWRPYHPSVESPFVKGPGSLWEIPVSACGLPFVSNTERLFGLAFMKTFFHALYVEARISGKPIVFVLHAEDLNALRDAEQVGRLSWRHFLPSRDHGFLFRFFLLESNWRLVCRDMVALFRYMKSFPVVRFVTVRDYVEVLDRQRTTGVLG